GVLLPPQSRQVAVGWQGVVSQFGSRAQGRLNAWLASRLGSSDSVPQNTPSDTGAAAAAAAVPPNPLVPGDEASASCPTGSVWIAAGSFRMGSDSAEAGLTHSGPEHDVTVSHGYCIDRFEVTV